jgi:hypothetical protein
MAFVKDGPYHLEAVHQQTICFIHQNESCRIRDRPLERFESLVSLKIGRISGWAITRGSVVLRGLLLASAPVLPNRRLGTVPPNVEPFETPNPLPPLQHEAACPVQDAVGAQESETSPTLGLHLAAPRVQACEELTPNSAESFTPNNSQSNKVSVRSSFQLPTI